MNMVKSAEVECHGPLTKSVQQPPVRAYMDDLTVMTSSVLGSRAGEDHLMGKDEVQTREVKIEEGKSCGQVLLQDC